MKKFYTATLALMVAVSAAAAPQIRQILPVKKAFKMSANLNASASKTIASKKVRAAEESESIEGYYDFTLGDYYFQTSTQTAETVPSNLTLDGTTVTITSESEYFASDLVGTYDANANKLTFSEIKLGAVSIQGTTYYIAFQPFVYTEVGGKGSLNPTDVIGTYDPSAGSISFESDHGFSWEAYKDADYTESAGYVEIWDVLGMKKGVDPEAGWTDLDQPAKWMDRMVWPMFMDAAPTEKEITVQVNEDQPGMYRMIAPFADIWGDANIILDASNPNDVVIELQNSGIVLQDMGTCYVASTGEILEDPSQGGTITMKDNRIEFPTKSVWMYFPQYNPNSVYYNPDQTEPGYLELPTDDSGVADIVIDENAPVEYYNLQGVRVANPAQGELVIIRQGSKAMKSIIR